MNIPQEFKDILSDLFHSPVLQQVLPLIVVLLVPLLVLTAQAHISSLFRSFLMVLDTLSLVFPWNWSAGSSSPDRKKSRKKLVRTRAEHIALNGDAFRSSKDMLEDGGYYPGIVNISGTYCFMDSTLQALASLSYLQPYIDEIHAKAEALDVPTPVLDALKDILHTLNTPHSSPRAIRPVEMINALSQHSKGKQNSLFSSREHQDAQELFQLISECIKSEAAAVDNEDYRDRGLGGLSERSRKANREIGKSVFDGLTANRRSCVQCGYTEAVMHFAFDNWQLAVPRMSACRLEECLADYTRLEILDDCICRKCSMLATYHRLAQEAEKVTELTNADPNASASKKKRSREARKLAARVKAALDEGRIEEDIKGVKMEKVFSKASTKQAMIARPPPVLALHLNRSVHYGHYASKNTCRVVFPEYLDLTPFTTSGQLSTVPSSPISTPPPPIPRSTTPTPSTYSTSRTFYRLSSVVCHYGQHSFGHYVCYRRKPRPMAWGAKRFAPPRMACPLGCECENCERYGPFRDEDPGCDNSQVASIHPTPGKGWLRISDDSVSECGWESVVQEASGAFMLYYERIIQPGVYSMLNSSPRSSEETLKPRMALMNGVMNGNGSNVSLMSGDGVVADGNAGTNNDVLPNGAMPKPKPKSKLEEGLEEWRGYPRMGVVGARIVRNVSTPRARSVSVPPPPLPALAPGSSTVLSGSLPLSSGLASLKQVQVHEKKPQMNGDASHPPLPLRPPKNPLTSNSMNADHSGSSHTTFLSPPSAPSPPPSPHSPSSSEEVSNLLLSSSSPVRLSSSSSSPSPTSPTPRYPTRHHPPPRLKSPQPISPPPRTVGLRA